MQILSDVGDSPGFESSRTQRELARETGAMGIERGGDRFAQHRITGRHVIGRRPSRLVGTDELLREKEPRGGGEQPVRKRRREGEEEGATDRKQGGNGWTLERGLVTRVEYESSAGREEEGDGGERAPRVLRY